MIKAQCFTKEWVNGFKQQKNLKRINPPILEKMIHALSLLQQLKAHGLDFIFKGGTSLVLLLSKSRRFSVDIDIITTQSREEIEAILDKVVSNSHFNGWELQDRRSYKEGVPKAHYEFDYESSLNQSAHFVLLDILFEQTDYPRLLSAPIQSEWIETEEVLKVAVPSIESILGDKLTAFAPNTVGILYGTEKEQEIIKQLFDIGCLFDEAENVEEIALSFEKIGAKEINYRELEISLTDILEDIFTTSLLIAKRTKNTTKPDKTRFTELTTGIRRFGGFLIAENFKIEDAILAAGKAAYLAKQLRNRDFSALEKFNGQVISKLEITGELNFLNKLKKSRDKAAFFYWYKALN
ncbi:hypothetical protein J2X69_003075 [Algoriphagus sp. 4150]|uniref:nucleotidyl transferase AbiEii/AbiGii toxin family protein n=1 Tax=Algoriphagus sp. 4150 TaxID=2817756 RepID=UPI0028589896|nr:nucleotidyl transferase AbiEii/AbiGii toxin family protein [Algoriphagus sp. 4150]MDR7130718.1 hypothetical protein [Algoriphagus sp. 4150]